MCHSAWLVSQRVPEGPGRTGTAPWAGCWDRGACSSITELRVGAEHMQQLRTPIYVSVTDFTHHVTLCSFEVTRTVS